MYKGLEMMTGEMRRDVADGREFPAEEQERRLSQLLSGTTVGLRHLPSRLGGQRGAHHEDGKWVKAERASLQCLEAELELQGPGN